RGELRVVAGLDGGLAFGGEPLRTREYGVRVGPVLERLGVGALGGLLADLARVGRPERIELASWVRCGRCFRGSIEQGGVGALTAALRGRFDRTLLRTVLWTVPNTVRTTLRRGHPRLCVVDSTILRRGHLSLSTTLHRGRPRPIVVDSR